MPTKSMRPEWLLGLLAIAGLWFLTQQWVGCDSETVELRVRITRDNVAKWMRAVGNDMLRGRAMEVADLKDAWGHDLRVELQEHVAVVRSAGQDRMWATSDDMVVYCR